ncbi:unnamed protein product [Nippostrongylus brasiliensis]|uniref:Actin-interacting protein 1 n=1 Tax=Nippostrongylus brasiliensis TaxID=27835 RepID=A0A0N4XWS7_NIPBR|nr:hypothetical protein Q1695_001701 [Nippostrongylus brasiliensis]VDL70965.1 unnamed protein product [Nippostrongylus brasiliensis]
MNAGDSNEYTNIRVFASLPRTTRGFPTVLGSTPNGDKIIYCNGNSVFIVDVENVTDVDIYTEHSVQTTVAKMSPSGFYIASGDCAGNVRIWDTTQSTHILKAAYQVFSGSVRDIAWNDDSKRIAAVGEGRERFGHVFLFDTGTSNGNLSGQSRPMSTIDFRPARPYRLVSGSEDNTVALFEGPPFKFKTTFHEHSRFVHVTRYNKDGSVFASAGVDGNKIGELTDPSLKGETAHSGSVFGLAWSPCGNRIATASGDKTVKIWNVSEKSLEKTVNFGDTIDDQQIGICWSAKALVSVSLAGFLSFLGNDGELVKVVEGHNKGITTVALSPCKNWLFTADFEGHLTRWEVATGASKRIQPALHKSQVVGLSCGIDGHLITCAWDDTVRFARSVAESADVEVSSSVKLPSQPVALAVAEENGLAIVACCKNVLVFVGDKLSTDLPLSYNPSCVAVSGRLVAIGGQDSKVHIYDLSGTTLAEQTTLSHSSPITSVAFSFNGKYLAATDSGRKVVPYAVEDGFKTVAEKEWTFHTAKVNCVAWSPDNRHLASGGLDTSIIVWDIQRSGEHPIIIRGAHAMAPVNDLVFLSDNEILSVGQDANVKHWKFVPQ